MRSAQISLLVAAAMFAAVPAVAAPAKGKQKAAPKESEEAKKLAEEAAEKARAERESRVPEVVKEVERKKDVEVQSGPRLSVEEFRRKTEFQVQAKRDDQLKTLDQIIKLGPPPEEMPALLFQKAELYQENSQSFFFSGMEKDDEMLKARDAGNASKEKAAKKAKEDLLAKSKKWQDDADKIYEEIVKKHPKFDRMDQVLYALGRARWDGGRQKEALDVYRQLIQDHPKSPYVADAYLAFGEFHFANKKVENALAAYKKASAYEDSKVFGYAVYKQGWCHYNMTQWEDAADKFKEVVLYSQLNEDKLGDKRIVLTREARKDYVTVYSHFGKPEQAFEDFKTLAEGDEHWKMVERLAGLYYSEGQDREAAVVYLMLIRANKENTRNPFFQGRIVSSASRQGNKRVVVKYARMLVEEFKRVREQVGKMDPKDPKRTAAEQDLRDAEDLSDNTLRSLATTWHNEARKTRDEETYEQAYELYGDYLDLFPDKPTTYDMRFYYAELNYKLEKFEKAAEQYSLTLDANPKGKWAEPSAEEAVRAYDELVQDWEKKSRKEQPKDYDPTKPQPIPEIKQKLVKACQSYLKYFEKGRIALEATYKVARVYYDANMFDDAVPIFHKVIEAAPEHPRAEQAASLILDVHNLREDWEALYNASRLFQKNKALMSKEEFAKSTNEVLESSSFKVIANLQKKGAYEEAAKRYLAFADEFQKSTLADKALANAAANYQLAGLPAKSVKVRDMLISAFPDSPLVPDALFSVAESHEQIAELDKAADVLEKFVKKYPKDQRSKDAIFNAGIYREGYGGSKNLAQAVADREQYLKEYPGKDALQVQKSICRLYEQSKQKQKTMECLEAFGAKFMKEAPQEAWEARFKVADMVRQGNIQKGDVQLMKLMAEYKKKYRKLPEGSVVSARIALHEADYEFAKYKKTKIEDPDLKKMKQFQKSLAEKVKGRDAVRKVYTDVVKLKEPDHAIAALYRIGELNLHYMEALLAVPAPKDLKGEQKEIFKEKLRERAAPIEDEAVAAFKICVQKSQELRVFNSWTGKCLDVLEAKRPDEFPKLQVERMPAPQVKPPMPHFVVVDLPKEGGDLVALGTPPPRLVPLPFAPAKPEGAPAGGEKGGEGGGEEGGGGEGESGGGGP